MRSLLVRLPDSHHVARLTLALFLLLCAPAAAQETPRQREVLRGVASYAPWDCPDRWLPELGPAARRTPLVMKRLLRERSWVRFLAYAVLLDWGEDAREETCRTLMAKVGDAPSGKVRQNLLFLVALTAPDPGTLLWEVEDAGWARDADRLDARCALAMLGDEDAMDWFEDYKGSDALQLKALFEFSHYEALEGREEARPLTLSYRCWEVLFARPYFRRLGQLRRVDLFGLGRGRVTEARRRATVARLLPKFLDVWPGHPGSDDFAAHLCHAALGRGARLEAARWAQRSMRLPDHDCTLRREFAALVETQLTEDELYDLRDDDEVAPDRELVEYSLFLRLVREDLAAGLERFRKLAEADPTSSFARARLAAAHQGIPEGLRSGQDQALSLELGVTFPERSKRLARTVAREPEGGSQDEAFYEVLVGREREVAERTRSTRGAAVRIPQGRLASQLRLLVELQELVRREEAAGEGARKADLRYRQAMLVYHHPDAFFPVWAPRTMSFAYELNAVRCDAQADARLADWAGQALHLRRAYALLDSLRTEFPDYAGMDQVLFRMGRCLAELLDYRPSKALDVWVLPGGPPAAPVPWVEHGHLRVAGLFERLAREHPASPLAARAASAALWRRGEARHLRLRRTGR